MERLRPRIAYLAAPIRPPAEPWVAPATEEATMFETQYDAGAGAFTGSFPVGPAPHSWQNRAVDFVREIDEVGTFLGQAGFPFAVVGGVALAAYGHPRMTLDLDLITDAAAQEAVVAFMESRGFATLHRSSGYSNHLHADRARGRVDFVYVRGETARRLFDGVRTVSGPGGLPILVPRPEHLIAMKVQAMRDAPERTWQELVDISYLAKLDGVDRTEIRGYFERNGLAERWRELERAL